MTDKPGPSLQEIADMAKRAELYVSMEYRVWAYYDVICKGYLAMTNTQSGAGFTHADAKQGLDDIRKISREWYQFMVEQLRGLDIKDLEHKNVNYRVQPNLTSYFLNSGQYIQRFCFSPPPSEETQWKDWKMMNLVCVTYMVRNLIDIADATKLEDFIVDPFANC